MRNLLIALCACAAILPSISPASARSLEKDAWGGDPNARCLQRDNPSFYKSLRDAADDIRDKELPVCDADDVQETLKRVTHLTTVVETKNIKSDNLTESRFCKAEIVAANGSMIEVVYELRWTSQTEGRFWLQIKGARYL